jgi:hypothetical protein
VVERRRWRMRLARAASTAAVETGGVVESAWRGLRQFFRNICGASQDVLLFIGLKLSEAVRKREPLLIVFELISSDSVFKPLLIELLSEVVQA